MGCNPCPGPDGAKVSRPLPTRRKSDPFTPNSSVRNTGSVPTFAGSTSFSAMTSRQQPLTDTRDAIQCCCEIRICDMIFTIVS